MQPRIEPLRYGAAPQKRGSGDAISIISRLAIACGYGQHEDRGPSMDNLHSGEENPIAKKPQAIARRLILSLRRDGER